MLHGTDVGLLARLEMLNDTLQGLSDAEDRALLRVEIANTKDEMRDAKRRNFLDAKNSVLACTASTAIAMIANEDIKNELERGKVPFTTVVIDEAGMISRAAAAVISLLAGRRLVLVGDSKQLSPITKISRILPPSKERWVAASGLSHLDDSSSESVPENVRFLETQYRMHPEIGDAVSNYLYDNKLRHAQGLEKRPFVLQGDLFEPLPRAVWCVLDAEVPELPSIRADRGPGNKSWVRKASIKVLDKLFSAPDFAKSQGLFISPFTAQAKKIQEYLAKNDLLETWSTSTVHTQQGQESEIVIFDTVNAGSFGWSRKEWNRMINVALSRAKELLILIASRDEMQEPYLCPLMETMHPKTISVRNGILSWNDLDEEKFPLLRDDHESLKNEAKRRLKKIPEGTLGRQISERAALHPVLSQEQQQLCGYRIDGKPRLVRGVAGSGKTAVLAEWLVRSLNEHFSDPAPKNSGQSMFWVVFGNRALEKLLSRNITNAWNRQNPGRPFPLGKVEFLPIWKVLEDLAKECGLPKKEAKAYDFRYDNRSKEIIEKIGSGPITPLCDALFLDEAQDMGPNTLKLLFSLVKSNEGGRETEKPIFIFYDNAQDIYNSGTPKWSDLGLEMRGRSSIMKESFRSTRCISEYAINVLYALKQDELGPDHAELVEQGLLVPSSREGEKWWEVRFNQIEGPSPEFKNFNTGRLKFNSLDYYRKEFTKLGQELHRLLIDEHVSPNEICILCNNKDRVKSRRYKEL